MKKEERIVCKECGTVRVYKQWELDLEGVLEGIYPEVAKSIHDTVALLLEDREQQVLAKVVRTIDYLISGKGRELDMKSKIGLTYLKDKLNKQ